MTANITNTMNDSDEILIAFAEAGSKATVAEWGAAHPDQARELARFAASRGIVDTIQPAPEAVARIREIGLGVLRSCRAVSSAAPLTDLLAEAKGQGITKAALAARLDLPYALLMKLHRRLVAFDTVPRALVASLAKELGRTRDEITAYLRQPPLLAAGASYRSDEMPTTGEAVDFAQALLDDPEVTLAQKTRWLSRPETE